MMRTEGRLIAGRCVVPMLVFLMAMGSGTFAAEDGALDDAGSPVEGDRGSATDRWHVELEPMVWYAALQGDITLGGGSAFDVEVLDIDEPRLAPAGGVSILADRWSFAFSGFGFGIDGDHRADEAIDAGDVVFQRGERVDVDLDYRSFKLTAGYRVFTLPVGAASPDDGLIEDPAISSDVAVSLDVYGGARLYDVNMELTGDGGESVADDGTWVEPIGGVRLRVDLPYRTGLNFFADGGGFSTGGMSSYSFDIGTSFTWQFMDHAGLEIGFRHLSVDLEDGDDDDGLEFNAALAGLYGAVVIRF